MSHESRTYLIIDASEISKVNFDVVLETSEDTLRKNVDGTKTFVKYEGEMPQSLQALTTASQPYTHQEIISILNTLEWIIDDI